MKKILIPLLILLSIHLEAQTFSQKSTTQGFAIALNLGYAGWGGEDLDPFTGGGIGFNFSPSYGFNERFTLFSSIEFAPNVNLGPLIEATTRSTLFEVGAKWMFGSTTSALRPFIQAELMGHAVVVNDDIDILTFAGSGAGFGTGVKYFINPELAVSLALSIDFGTYTNVRFNDIQGDKDLAFYTKRAFIGMSYNFY